ncbi:MAG: DsrE family protein [Dehalococcoidales bacterium]|jgi:uncharacterized protein involved in oxidation of intracellular sulfur
MKTLLILNRNPYDGTDITWNALRLAEKLLEQGTELRIFLMNDSIDLAKEGVVPPEGYFNLKEMLADLIAKEIPVKVCGSCMTRCGIHKDKPLISGAMQAKMPELAEWVVDCDKVVTF